jgi:uncharacterized membrane protein (UPF0127 family)
MTTSLFLTVRDRTRGVCLGNRVEVARSVWARGRGLLGRSGLPAGGGLLIIPCNSIHSWFMRFPFDALFLDREFRVIHAVHAMPPWRVSPIVRRSHAVLELPAGTARAAGVGVGDQLVLES